MRKLNKIKCKHCGKSFKPDLSIRKYCSKTCSGKGVPHPKGNKSPRWKGGIHRRKVGSKRNQPSGYIEVWTGKRWIGEHRLIIQIELDRKLKRNEHIHHINGIRNDNRRKNLMLLSTSQHNSLEKPKQVINWTRDKLGRWI